MDADAVKRLLQLAQDDPRAFDALLTAAKGTAQAAAPTSGPTVRRLWEEYSAYATESIASWPQNQKSAEKHILGFFGDREWHEVSPALVREYRRLRRGQVAKLTGKPISAASRNKEVRALKSMFTWAVREKLIPVSVSPLRESPDEPEINERDFHVTEDDFVLLLRHARPLLRSMLVLAFETGMRRDEYRLLSWPEVDEENGIITLPPERHKAGRRTRQPRLIPLSTLALETIGRQSRVCRWVFPCQKGKPIPRTTLWDWFAQARTDAKLRGPKDQAVWLHSMRKSFGSLAALGGMPVDTAMDIAGWRDKKTMDKYRSMSAAHIRMAREQLDARLRAPDRIRRALTDGDV